MGEPACEEIDPVPTPIPLVPAPKLPKGYVLEPVREKPAEPEPISSPDGGRSIRARPRINYAEIASPKTHTPIASVSTKKRAAPTKKSAAAAAVAAAAKLASPAEPGLEVDSLAQNIASLQSQIEKIETQVDSGPAKKRARTTPAKSATEPKSGGGGGGVRPVRTTAGKKSSANARGKREPSPVLKHCARILQKIMLHRHAWPFNSPVDPVALGIPDYFDIIKQPMDFGTIQAKLENNEYTDPQEFADDVRLVFTNCRTYNAPGSDIVFMANVLENETFEPAWAKLPRWQATQAAKSSAMDLKKQLSELTGAMLAVQQQMASLTQAAHLQPAASATSPRPAGAANRAGGSSSSSSANRRRSQPTMSFEEKRWLSDQITLLDHEPLVTVVQIIHESHPITQTADGSAPDIIEIDIDSLDTNALRKLMAYVKKVTGNQPPTRRKSSSSSNRPAASPTAAPATPSSSSSSPSALPAANTTTAAADANATPSAAAAVDDDNSSPAEPQSNTGASPPSALDLSASMAATPTTSLLSSGHPNQQDDEPSFSSETDSSTSDDDDDDLDFDSPAILEAPKIIDPETNTIPQPELQVNSDRWSNLGGRGGLLSGSAQSAASASPAGWGDFLQKQQLEAQRERERQEREEQRERERIDQMQGRMRDEELLIQQEMQQESQAQEEAQRLREEARERAKLQRAQFASTADHDDFALIRS